MANQVCEHVTPTDINYLIQYGVVVVKRGNDVVICSPDIRRAIAFNDNPSGKTYSVGDIVAFDATRDEWVGIFLLVYLISIFSFEY